MKHLRRGLRPLAVGAALSVALVACGDTDEPTTTETTGSQATQTEAPAETESATTADTETETPDTGQEASENPFVDLKMAAQHVGSSGSAKALADGIASAAGLEGDIEWPAVQTYAALSTLLQEHVYLAGVAVDTAVLTSPDDPRYEAATDALDENSVELADLVGSVAPDQRDAFLGLWREHIGFFVDYTLGVVGGDEQARQTALDSLDGYRQQAGAFFEQITGGELPADAVAESLSGHITSLTSAIDGAAAAFAKR